VKPALGRTVLALGLVSFFQDVGSEMVFPLLPALLGTLGAGPAFLGLLEGTADACAAAVKYYAGGFSDRVQRRKPLVVFGYSVPTLTRPLIALATSPWHVFGIRIVDRLGKGVRTAPRDALIAASVSADQAGRAFGFNRAMDHAGAVVGPLLATLLLSRGVEVKTIFLLTVIPGTLAVLFTLAAKEAPPVTPTAPTERPAHSAPLAPRLKSLLWILGLFALGNSSDAFLLVRAKEVGFTDASLPLLWITLHVSKVTFSWLGGRVVDRLRKEVPIFLGWGVYAFSYLGLALADSQLIVVALFFVYGAFNGLAEPAEKALVRALAPEEIRGRAFGLYHGVLGAAAIPAGLLTGALWSGYGHAVALGTGAAIAAAAAVALTVWARGGTAHPSTSSG
jgi:MFS family permease